MGFPYIRKTSVMDSIKSSNIRVLDEDFHYDNSWVQDTSGHFAYAHVTTDYFIDTYSVCLVTTAGVLVNEYVSITKSFSFFSLSKYSCRFYMKFYDTADSNYFYFGIDAYHDGNAYAIKFRYSASADKLQFLNSAQNWQDFPAPTINLWHDKWQGFSFDFNLFNMTYGLFRFGTNLFDLSSEKLYSSAIGQRYAASEIQFKLEAGTSPIAGSYVYIDNLSIFAL